MGALSQRVNECVSERESARASERERESNDLEILCRQICVHETADSNANYADTALQTSSIIRETLTQHYKVVRFKKKKKR